MRGSPIHNLRSANANENSPYRAGVIRRTAEKRELYETASPQKMMVQNANLSETEYWKFRARKYEAELLSLNEELMLQNRKLFKIEELEEKIEVLLRQNTHLVEESDNLLKVIQQKQAEADSWRRKFDSEFNTTNALENEARQAYHNLNYRDEQHRLATEKLLAEISDLHNRMQEQEKLHLLEVEGLKNKYEVEAMRDIQNLKRSQMGNTELFEIQIRKLKDALDEKNFELENNKKDSKLECERLNGQISFLKNETKKIEQQKESAITQLKAEHENNVNNLVRHHKKTEEDLKNLHENKVRRLGYEVEEKKNEIEECLARLRKTGKEGELELVRLIEDKDRLRLELNEEAVRHANNIAELNQFWENQLQNERDAAVAKERNTQLLLEGDIDKLRRVIEKKQAEIEALLAQNDSQRRNEEIKLHNKQELINELRNKLTEVITHYEREIELLKIKTSKLYEADLEALKGQLTNQAAYMSSENAKLKQTLTETKDRLVQEVEDKLMMRKDYENRFKELNNKYEREHQKLQDLLVMAEKNYSNVRSQTSIRDIEHTSTLKRQHTTFQGVVGDKRVLESQIQNKNKEIEELNLRIQKMQGQHEHDINKLQQRLNEEQERYKKWVSDHNKENKGITDERNTLKDQLKAQSERFRKERDENERTLTEKNQEIETLRLRMAQLEGTLEEWKREHGSLDVKLKLEKGNIEKTNLELETIMNNERDRLDKIREDEKAAIRNDYESRLANLNKEIGDLNKHIDSIRQAYEEEKLKSRALETELGQAYAKVDEKSKLEQHVINIGLSNNYFKNIAEIFKKPVE